MTSQPESEKSSKLEHWSPLWPDVGINRLFNLYMGPFAIDLDLEPGLSAFPVPSLRQYKACVDQNGESAWTREGVWRCLLPQDTELRRKLGDHLFSDYTGFLEWQRTRLESSTDSLAARPSQSDATPSYIDHEEALKQGKPVVSSYAESRTVTQHDGSTCVKRVVENTYADGTRSKTETSESLPKPWWSFAGRR